MWKKLFKNLKKILFKAFPKEHPVILILIPEVWTEEMKLFALHISYSTKMRNRIRTGQKHADRDPVQKGKEINE